MHNSTVFGDVDIEVRRRDTFDSDFMNASVELHKFSRKDSSCP